MLNTYLHMVPEYHFAFNYPPLSYAYLLKFLFLFYLFSFYLQLPMPNAHVFCTYWKLCFSQKWMLSLLLKLRACLYGQSHPKCMFNSGLCQIGLCCMCTIRVHLFSGEQPNKLHETSFLHSFLVHLPWVWVCVCICVHVG